MGLTLKESNSPFWLIGLNKQGRPDVGSDSNIPCYYKSYNKWHELGVNMIKGSISLKKNNITEVYAITGVAWDNMNSSWDAKQQGSYIKSKGKLVATIKDVDVASTKTESKGDYSKGVSREPLPKKGAKVYTSPATALESPLELKEDNKYQTKDITDYTMKDIDKKLKTKFDDILANGEMDDMKKLSIDDLKKFYVYVDNTIEGGLSKDIVGFSIRQCIDDKQSKSSKPKDKDNDKKMNESVNPQAIITAIMFAVDNWDTLKDIIETTKDISNDIYNKAMDVFNSLKSAKADIKEAIKQISKIFSGEPVVAEALKESKIVQPIGNPQIANAFVNIDVDLDHVEVSDFIVRLAQAIRSEQQSTLEYVALRSANGITNEDRNVIDSIIEEEKNHMVAFATLLYKQMLTNHSKNVDKAKEEFTLPTFGQNDVMDEDNKLTESLSTCVNKILKESIKGIDDFIKEVQTDTNYDEIAYHIHELGKVDKAKASKAMDKLWELENDKTPKECRDAIIGLFQKNEEVNFSINDSYMSKTIYEVEADVNYDEDYALQVVDSVKRAIKSYNGITSNDSYGADADSVSLENGKLKFSLITLNGFLEHVDESFISSYVTNICKQASIYEYYIELK